MVMSCGGGPTDVWLVALIAGNLTLLGSMVTVLLGAGTVVMVIGACFVGGGPVGVALVLGDWFSEGGILITNPWSRSMVAAIGALVLTPCVVGGGLGLKPCVVISIPTSTLPCRDCAWPMS